ncbi:Uracil phosphoribosyltransferase protein [Penicillium angulare]|uniref:Uracil phosphoribosyltransferase protein n=1 Tax=Penicillium angulare TaxID=116970 RepID=UPI0025413F3F|nr:Uracil phosphoribosyltransferase protein [Penicillium angulare]KAJ5261129.1 Uracil phosphoribosyltransferase protein [Penicillium angulare]
MWMIIDEVNLNGKDTIVLVDFVMNTENRIFLYIDRIRSLDDEIRIVVMAGIIYTPTDDFIRKVKEFINVSFFALSLSNDRPEKLDGRDTGW